MAESFILGLIAIVYEYDGFEVDNVVICRSLSDAKRHAFALQYHTSLSTYPTTCIIVPQLATSQIY